VTERVWFKIGETAACVGATPKELRYWEKVIPELQPRRSRGNLRYYHQDEIARLRRIRQWLAEGCTVADCRLQLQGLPVSTQSQTEPIAIYSSQLRTALEALRKLREHLSLPPGIPVVVTEVPPEEPHLLLRPKNARIRPMRPAVSAPSPPALPLEADVLTETPKTPSNQPIPKRPQKPKPETSALGRMWSVTRLPLDLDE